MVCLYCSAVTKLHIFLFFTTALLGVDLVSSGAAFSRISVLSHETRDHFRELCQDIFSIEGPVKTLDQMKAALEEAYWLTFNPLIQIEEFGLYNRAIREYRSLPEQSDCSSADLERRNILQRTISEYPSIRAFVSHHNDAQFKECAHWLNTHVQSHVNYGFKLTKNINAVVQKMRQRQREEANFFELAADLDVHELSRALCNYLATELQINIDKPPEVSMRNQIQRMKTILEARYWRECVAVESRFEEEFRVYAYLTMLRPHFNRLFFSDRVIQFFDEIYVCKMLNYSIENIYPLGWFRLNDLLDKILAPEGAPQLASLNVEQIRDLLDITVHVGQSELAYGNDNSIAMRHIIDLITVSQIETSKCETAYFKLVLDLRDRDRRYPLLREYLNFFSREQMIACIPELDSELTQKASEMMNCEAYLPEEVFNVTKVFTQVAQQVDPNLRLYKQVPFRILRLSLERYAKENGVSLADHLDVLNRADWRQYQLSTKSAYEICDKFEEVLAPSAEKFQVMLEFDTEPQSLFHETILGLMTDYKICQAIVSLPLAMRLVDNDNSA